MTTKRQRLGITKKYRGYPKRATYLLNPLYLDEITYIIDKEEFKMQEDDLHLKHITTYLWEKCGIDIEGIADSNQPFSEYSTNDFLVSIYRDNITIMVEVCRYLRKLS